MSGLPACDIGSPLLGDTPAKNLLLQQSHKGRLPAWLLSLLVHLVLLVSLAYLIHSQQPHGGNVQRVASGGIMLVERGPIDQKSVTPFDSKSKSDSNSESQQSEQASKSSEQASAATALPAKAELQIDLTGVLPATGPPVHGSGDATDLLPNPSQFTRGKGPSKNIPGGGVQTQVFGVQGQGSKFLYVFDRSGSMAGYRGRPLRAAKRELIASLGDLQRTHQFQIIFYNQAPMPFCTPGNKPRMMWGDERSKALAKQFINGVVADGSTKHLQALVMALKLHPDVIFFLTDADEPRMTADELAMIRRLNTHGTSINTIEFGFGPDPKRENFLKKLARQNGGKSGYCDISKLP